MRKKIDLIGKKKGEKMIERESGKEKENQVATLADRLPMLNENQRRNARSPKSKSWAIETVGQGAGHIRMADGGVILQVYDESTIRLLTVVDHEYFIESVSYLKATLDSVGIHLDMDLVVMRDHGAYEDEMWGSVETAQNSAVEVV